MVNEVQGYSRGFSTRLQLKIRKKEEPSDLKNNEAITLFPPPQDKTGLFLLSLVFSAPKSHLSRSELFVFPTS